ncbi:hypothetical protein ACE6H2_015999 [Prunus campanulata]
MAIEVICRLLGAYLTLILLCLDLASNEQLFLFHIRRLIVLASVIMLYISNSG